MLAESLRACPAPDGTGALVPLSVDGLLVQDCVPDEVEDDTTSRAPGSPATKRCSHPT